MKHNGHDIYGQNLLKGHCEVHPHVAHNFPCPECRNEEDDRQVQWDAYKQYCIEQKEQYDQEMLLDYVENIKHMDGGGI